MSIELLTEEIMKKFYQFTDGVRVMMLIDRGIQTSNKGSRRWINKLISTNTEEFKNNLSKLLHLQLYLNNPDIRIYLSLNARKMDKAIKLFQHKQIDLSTEDEILFFYKNINNNFCSALMKPESRASSLFLIDYDRSDASISDLLIMLEIDKIEVLFKYKTPNGWHIITNPFNPALLQEFKDCEVKKDALILLNP